MAPSQAVLFDLDDTLYPQAEFLAGAWRAVAVVSATLVGLPADTVLEALTGVAAEGSDRGRIIDRALERLGTRAMSSLCRSSMCSAVTPRPGCTPIGELEAPWRHSGAGADRARQRRRRRDPAGEAARLGLEAAFDAIVFSDELGREHRKPDPLPFNTALEALGVRAAGAVYVGDRPDKDVAGATGAGLRAVRVLTGEYAAEPGEVAPWRQAPDVFAVIRLVGRTFARGVDSGPDGESGRL